MNKQQILEEIARTTSQNHGVALGRQRFFQETGIKESDWLGKFWARWSDAVKEAGCVPQRLQSPIEEEALLEHFVALVRELGHVPVVADLKLKAKESPGFPSHNTFRRFGTKKQQVQKAVEYCKCKPCHSDVLAVLVASNPDTAAAEIAPLSEAFGYVYLLKASGYFKIGRSRSFERRARELALQLPERAETVHVIRTDDPSGLNCTGTGDSNPNARMASGSP